MNEGTVKNIQFFKRQR